MSDLLLGALVKLGENVREVAGGNFDSSLYVIPSHISVVDYCWTFSSIWLN